MTTGFTYPIQLRPRNRGGGISLSSGNARVQEQIMEILETEFLERVLRPGFGSDNLLFQAVNEGSIISSKIQFSLNRYLSSNITTQIKTQVYADGKVAVQIDWQDTSSNRVGVVKQEFIR